MASKNQQPEQIIRDTKDQQRRASSWSVQSQPDFDFSAGERQAIKEYQTDTGPADYILFVDHMPVAVIKVKKEALGHAITTVENQQAVTKPVSTSSGLKTTPSPTSTTSQPPRS